MEEGQRKREMVNLEQAGFAQVVREALRRAEGEPRWQSAIRRAARMAENNPYIHVDGEGTLMMSDTSLTTYLANSSCQCRAYRYGRPCKHRALNRLIRRYKEAEGARAAHRLAAYG